MPLDTKGTPIIDGFTYNSRVMHVSSYYHSAVAQLEGLRRANGFRPRWFGVPTSDQIPIPPFGSVEYQVVVQPGAYLWALNFWAETATPNTATQLFNSFRIVDACTELPIMDRPGLGALVSNNSVVGPTGTVATLGQNFGQTLLPQPYLINAPGSLNVEVTNGGPTSSHCQLLLCIAEPSINEKEFENLLNRVTRTR